MTYETGFFGIPGRIGGQVHVCLDGKPICGYRPHKRAEFQWCAHRIEAEYIECPQCKKKALVILTEEYERRMAILHPRTHRPSPPRNT